MNRSKLIILLIVALIQMGCVYIPLAHTRSGDIEIDDSFIQKGVTTKEDVFLRYGSPTTMPSDGEMIYEWTRFYGVWGFCIPLYFGCTAGGGDHVCSVTTKIQFDEHDIVSHIETTKKHDVPHGVKL